MSDFTHSLAIESWVLYSIGIILIAFRLLSRRITLGAWTKLQIEDYIMMFIAVTFTADMVSINQVAVNGSNYMDPTVAAGLDQKGIDQAIYGSKMTLALEMFTLATTWLVKACLLFMYHRLTMGLAREHLAVKVVAGYCVFGYLVVTILCLTVWCHPIYEYWRVPVKYSQCATYYHHMICATTFNISSDLMILCIPLPIVLRAQLPTKRKIVLVCVLGLGVFNILTAILNRYYNFNNPNSPEYLNWYVGEVATAVYVANIPLCWPLLQRVFRLNSWSQGSRPTHPSLPQASSKRLYSDSNMRTGRSGRAGHSRDDSILGISESEERITGGKTSQEEIMELTPVWHQTANRTTVHGGEKEERGQHQQPHSFKTGARDVEEGGIVRTVEVSQKFS